MNSVYNALVLTDFLPFYDIFQIKSKIIAVFLLSQMFFVILSQNEFIY